MADLHRIRPRLYFPLLKPFLANVQEGDLWSLVIDGVKRTVARGGMRVASKTVPSSPLAVQW